MPFSPAHLYFEDLEPGREWESMGRTVTEADIVNFAGLSGDFNPIHVDHSFAAETPFRRPIAHGMLVFSIASGLGVHSPPVRTLAFLGVKEWHFRGPVFPGDTVRIRGKVLEKMVRGRGKRGEIVWHRQILNQEGKVVQEGVLITLVEARGPKSEEPHSS
jgi:3-hydroxybutyryl-CoA dehydratase